MGLDWLYNPIAIPRDLIVKPIKDMVSGGDNKGGNAPVAPTPQPLPEAPKQEDSAMKAQDSVKKRRAAASQTVFTDPLGIGGQASIVQKTLTGQ